MVMLLFCSIKVELNLDKTLTKPFTHLNEEILSIEVKWLLEILAFRIALEIAWLVAIFLPLKYICESIKNKVNFYEPLFSNILIFYTVTKCSVV